MSDATKSEDPEKIVNRLFWKTAIGTVAFVAAVILYVFGVLF